jgi:hypothetical protein
MVPRFKIGIDPVTYQAAFIKPEYFFRHVFICGGTGTGKSAIFERLVQDCYYSRQPFMLVDPSGFLSRVAYSLVNGKAMYCSLRTPISLNPLVTPYTNGQKCDILVECVNQMITATTSNVALYANMIRILYRAVIWCLEHDRYTLEEVRNRVQIEDGSKETKEGLLARFDVLLQDEEFKAIVSGHDSLEINELLESGQSFIMDASRMGVSKKIFVGTLVIALLKAYLVYAEPQERKPILLLVDEAHGFLTRDFASVAREGRKHQISLCAATTDLSSFPKELTHTILSVSGNLICLRAGHEEAVKIANEIPGISAEEIQTLPKYFAVYRTPDSQGIVKLPRPPFAKEMEVKPVEVKKKNFDVYWFDLLQPYRFDLDYDQDGAVFSDDRRQWSETPPSSMKDG